MARTNTIPETLVPTIMKMLHDGSNATKISEWLKLEHDIDATPRTVAKRTQELRRLEQESKKLAIQEAAARSALDCVGIIDQGIMLLNQEAIKLLKSNDTESKLAGRQIAETALKYIDKKMNLTGMYKDEITDSDEELLNSLLKKLGE
jgi:predicted transcriptional regulator